MGEDPGGNAKAGVTVECFGLYLELSRDMLTCVPGPCKLVSKQVKIMP